MSSWDQGEVLRLKKNGNNVARKSWLAGAPEPGVGGRPKEGDDVNVFKRFIVAVYENKRYYREAGDAVIAIASNETRATPSQSQPSRHPRAVTHSPAPRPAPVPALAPAVDLLDFGAFDNEPAPRASVLQPTNPESDEFADFGAFDSAPARTPASSQPSNPGNDDFSDFSQAQPAKPAQPAFDPFNNHASGASNSMTAQANTMNDPFAPSATSNATTNELFAQPAPSVTQNATVFDPFNSNASTGIFSPNTNENNAQNKTHFVKSTNFMGGASSGNNMSNTMGNTNQGNRMNPGMMMNANQNMGMMNNGMMQNQGTMNQQQQQVMMMQQQMNVMKLQQQQQQQQQNNFGITGNQSMNNSMSNRGVGMGMQSNNNNVKGNFNSMNMNIMHKNDNSISNSFGANGTPSIPKTNDPFAGMGF